MASGDFKTQVRELEAFLASDDCKKLLAGLDESTPAINIGTSNSPDTGDFTAVWLSKNGLRCFSGDLDDWRLHGYSDGNMVDLGYRQAVPQDAVVAFRSSRFDHEARVGHRLSSVVALLSERL